MRKGRVQRGRYKNAQQKPMSFPYVIILYFVERKPERCLEAIGSGILEKRILN